jgi:hypothetical protein
MAKAFVHVLAQIWQKLLESAAHKVQDSAWSMEFSCSRNGAKLLLRNNLLEAVRRDYAARPDSPSGSMGVRRRCEGVIFKDGSSLKGRW